jgi:hypothetical protein
MITDDRLVPPPRQRSKIGAFVVTVAVIVFAIMWIYILFFAKASNPDVFPDRAWASRAEAACTDTYTRINALPTAKSFQNIEPKVEALRQRADVADQVTAELRSLTTTMKADPPADDRTKRVLALWFRDWDTYIADRDAHIVNWRNGLDKAFEETRNDRGQPTSYLIDPFAKSNKMPACIIPSDFG